MGIDAVLEKYPDCVDKIKKGDMIKTNKVKDKLKEIVSGVHEEIGWLG